MINTLKGEMIRLFIVIIILLIASTLFAQVNVETTGYDWIEYTPQQKTELVLTVYKIFKLDTTKPDHKIDNGVNALDGLYYIYYHEMEDSDSKHKEEAVKRVFSRPVMEILAEVITQPADTVPDKKLLKKYGLTYKK